MGTVVVLVVYGLLGALPERAQKRLLQAVGVIGIAVILLILVRVGLPWLAAGGTIVLGALRWLGPIALRLIPLLLSRRGKRMPSDSETRERVPRGSSSQMTRAEALEVLGLVEGASDEHVREAYSALIKKVHPDLGGTDYLATRVNLARDLLLSKQKR